MKVKVRLEGGLSQTVEVLQLSNHRRCAPVAQLDRALAYEARGRVFESPRAYQLNQ